jgi:ParB-like chromosome segregation protein Spo0J
MAIKINPSKRNTNKHTIEGMELLNTSISKVGAIEAISVTDEGTIISGHARKETFEKLGMQPVEVIIQANEYPVIVRNDIKDNTKEYFEAQILANTTAKKNINIDTALIEEIAIEYDLDIEELKVDIEQQTADIDYSILDGDDVTDQLGDMANGVKKAIQIEFEAEHYEEAKELIKFWREQKAYIGGMVMEHLKYEKEKI